MIPARAQGDASRPPELFDPAGSPPRRRWALGFFALATLLAFPHELPGIGAFDFGLVFAWLAPAALVVGLEGLAPRRAAGTAFFASLAAHVFLFHWFIVVTVTYGGMPLALGLLAPLLPAYWVAQFSALFAALWAGLAHRGRGRVLLGACAWVGVDWVRGWFLGGFPWATLGYALHADLPLLGFTRFGSVYALSFLASAIGLALGSGWLAWRAGRVGEALRTCATAVAALVAVHVGGHFLGSPAASDARSGTGSESAVAMVRIAAIQGNIDQGEKWDEARRERILATYLRLSKQAAEQGARWIVWPETAIPGAFEWDPELAGRINALARDHRVVLVIGGMGIELEAAGGEGERAYYDSAFVVDADGRLRDRYDKTHLVPFGEFVPLRALLGRFFESLATGLSASDVTPGVAPRALVLPGTEELPESLFAGVAICYELIFPDLVRRFAADGAGVLLGITNDAWYGRTGAPHQFLAMTAMRSAETGRAGVRAANTGISAIIDARGRVLEQSALFEEAVIVADVPVVRAHAPAEAVLAGTGDRTPATFYTRFGDIFAWGCMILALAGLAAGRQGIGDGAGGALAPAATPSADARRAEERRR